MTCLQARCNCIVQGQNGTIFAVHDGADGAAPSRNGGSPFPRATAAARVWPPYRQCSVPRPMSHVSAMRASRVPCPTSHVPRLSHARVPRPMSHVACPTSQPCARPASRVPCPTSQPCARPASHVPHPTSQPCARPTSRVSLLAMGAASKGLAALPDGGLFFHGHLGRADARPSNGNLGRADARSFLGRHVSTRAITAARGLAALPTIPRPTSHPCARWPSGKKKPCAS